MSVNGNFQRPGMLGATCVNKDCKEWGITKAVGIALMADDEAVFCGACVQPCQVEWDDTLTMPEPPPPPLTTSDLSLSSLHAKVDTLIAILNGRTA